MLRSVHFFIFLAFQISATAALGAVEKLSNGLRVEKILDNTYVVTDTSFFWANTLVAKMDDGTVVLASSPFESLGTQSLMRWINRTLKPKRVVAINTHFHSDGTGGNEVFKKMGVETWSSRLTQDLQRTELEEIRRETRRHLKSARLQKLLADTPIAYAESLFDLKTGKRFVFGGEEVEVFFPGHAHSPDNVVVFLKNRGVLFGGCIIKPKNTLGYLRDANVKNWATAAERLKKFETKIVVPGHGKWGGSELIDKTIRVARAAQQN